MVFHLYSWVAFDWYTCTYAICDMYNISRISWYKYKHCDWKKTTAYLWLFIFLQMRMNGSLLRMLFPKQLIILCIGLVPHFSLTLKSHKHLLSYDLLRYLYLVDTLLHWRVFTYSSSLRNYARPRFWLLKSENRRVM